MIEILLILEYLRNHASLNKLINTHCMKHFFISFITDIDT